jgi:hypothetical protein
MQRYTIDHAAIGTVAAHAGDAPFLGRSFTAYVSHQAADLAAGHRVMPELEDAKPFYQKR